MIDHTLSVAPMMDWTDRHCRFFHRLLSPHALLYTEMVTTGALLQGDAARHLAFNREEHPVALQLGGSEPVDLATAARLGEATGYDEINLNCGCPSERVQRGAFGACLMAEPDLVADCVAAMKDSVNLPVTVKCRIGIDEQDDFAFLQRFAEKAVAAGADALIVHARKAWLKGLSPKQNREIPPLDHDRVARLRAALPVPVILNGGLSDEAAVRDACARFDGAMIGRAAYQNPWLLARLEAALFGTPMPDPADVIAAMQAYGERQMRAGVPLGRIVRPMLGLFQGQPGARAWRRQLSEAATDRAADISVLPAAAVNVLSPRTTRQSAA